jgi:hypothetical protein
MLTEIQTPMYSKIQTVCLVDYSDSEMGIGEIEENATFYIQVPPTERIAEITAARLIKNYCMGYDIKLKKIENISYPGYKVPKSDTISAIYAHVMDFSGNYIDVDKR